MKKPVRTKKYLAQVLKLNKDGSVKVSCIKQLRKIEKLRVGENNYQHWQGNVRHSTLVRDFDLGILAILCDFTKGNNAPRNGANGAYVKLTTKNFNLLQKRLDILNEIMLECAENIKGKKK